MTEEVVYDPASGADAAGHNLLFVHESELDNEIDVPAADEAPADDLVLYEAETAPDQQPAEVLEPVGLFLYRQGNSTDIVP